MRRIVLVSCGAALIAALACGKYGRPERLSSPAPQNATSAPVMAADSASADGEEEPKSRKP